MSRWNETITHRNYEGDSKPKKEWKKKPKKKTENENAHTQSKSIIKFKQNCDMYEWLGFGGGCVEHFI